MSTGIGNISEVQFKEPDKLIVTYSSGAKFSYMAVSLDVYTNLMHSADIPRAVHKLIRSGNIVGVKR